MDKTSAENGISFEKYRKAERKYRKAEQSTKWKARERKNKKQKNFLPLFGFSFSWRKQFPFFLSFCCCCCCPFCCCPLNIGKTRQAYDRLPAFLLHYLFSRVLHFADCLPPCGKKSCFHTTTSSWNVTPRVQPSDSLPHNLPCLLAAAGCFKWQYCLLPALSPIVTCRFKRSAGLWPSISGIVMMYKCTGGPWVERPQFLQGKL